MQSDSALSEVPSVPLGDNFNRLVFFRIEVGSEAMLTEKQHAFALNFPALLPSGCQRSRSLRQARGPIMSPAGGAERRAWQDQGWDVYCDKAH